jgi:hypothetical protein
MLGRSYFLHSVSTVSSHSLERTSRKWDVPRLRRLKPPMRWLSALQYTKRPIRARFKHLFDLVRPNALVGKPVLLSATGGTPLHGLVTEHQLRPLFGFFNALTLPMAIFALEDDFQDYQIGKTELAARIKRAATEFAEVLETKSARQREPALALA